MCLSGSHATRQPLFKDFPDFELQKLIVMSRVIPLCVVFRNTGKNTLIITILYIVYCTVCNIFKFWFVYHTCLFVHKSCYICHSVLILNDMLLDTVPLFKAKAHLWKNPFMRFGKMVFLFRIMINGKLAALLLIRYIIVLFCGFW